MRILIILIFFIFSNPSYAMNVSWFNNFNDDRLNAYILEALENNKDIVIAKKNIQIYRQERNKNIARLFPNISVSPSYTLIKLPKTAIPNNDIQTNSFALPFLMAWEVDYLGERHNKIKKAEYDMKNAGLELKMADLTVASDVACAYFNASNIITQIELQKALVASIDAINERNKKKFASGTLSIIELNNSKKSLIDEESKLQNLYKEKEIFLTELSYLIGKSPLLADEIKINPIDSYDFTGVYPEKLTGDIILNRPDIIKLENEIKKSKLDILIARKDFLPKINVLGAMVFSTIVQNFGWKGVFAGLFAGATQNIFDGGRRIFNLKEAKYNYEKAYETYLKADLNALKEVNDSLYTLKKDMEIFDNTKKGYELNHSNFIKIFKSYDAGAKSFLELQTSEVDFNKSKMSLLNAKNQKFIDLISLYKAVGGAL